MAEEQRAFSGVQIQEKNIEPSKEYQDFLNRNFQLGNIPKQSFKIFAYEMKRAIDFNNFPYEQGGFLTEQYAIEKKKKIEALFVMSGSVDASVRNINNTFQQNQKLEQNSKGMFGSMFSKN